MMSQPKALIALTGAEENRHYLRVFIHTYRDLPVLWDTSLRDYTNRDKRAEAYEQLVPIYRYLKRDATVEDVKKKINTLRTNYRKELKVVESARRAGSMHQPRCWTFHELDFLRNTEKFLAVNPNAARHGSGANDHFVFNENSQSQASFMDTNSAYNFKAILSQASPLHSPPPSITEMFQKSFGHQTQPKYEPHQSPLSLPPPTPSLPLPPPPSSTSATAQQTMHGHGIAGDNYAASLIASAAESQNNDLHSTGGASKRPRLSNYNGAFNGNSSEDLLNIARDYLQASYPEEETLSRTWAHKLKRLQKEQRLLAEKFINDVLFEAESGTLHRGSIQINVFEPYVRYEEHSNDNDSSEQHQHQQQQHHHHHIKSSQSPIVQSSTQSATTTTSTASTNPSSTSPTNAATTCLESTSTASKMQSAGSSSTTTSAQTTTTAIKTTTTTHPATTSDSSSGNNVSQAAASYSNYS